LLHVDFSLAAISLNLVDRLAWISRLGLVKKNIENCRPHKAGRS
jgi:hypothetical protein